MRKYRSKKGDYGYLFIMPFFLVFIAFQLYPIIYTLYLSFTKYDGIGMAEFIGFSNYIRLTKDPIFIKSIVNTLKIWIINFIPTFGFGIVLAAIFTRTRLKGTTFFKSAYFLPHLVTAACMGVLFSMLLGRQSGTFNHLLIAMGLIKEPIYFLNSPWWSSVSVSFILWWMWFGIFMIILMTGMKAIPDELYEAAAVDGANGWNCFWKITVPLIRRILLYIFVTSVIGGMQNFDIPYVFGEGGVLNLGLGAPQKSILTVTMYLYNTAFKYNNRGYGASIAFGLFVVILSFSIMFFSIMNRRTKV